MKKIFGLVLLTVSILANAQENTRGLTYKAKSFDEIVDLVEGDNLDGELRIKDVAGPGFIKRILGAKSDGKDRTTVRSRCKNILFQIS